MVVHALLFSVDVRGAGALFSPPLATRREEFACFDRATRAVPRLSNRAAARPSDTSEPNPQEKRQKLRFPILSSSTARRAHVSFAETSLISPRCPFWGFAQRLAFVLEGTRSEKAEFILSGWCSPEQPLQKLRGSGVYTHRVDRKLARTILLLTRHAGDGGFLRCVRRRGDRQRTRVGGCCCREKRTEWQRSDRAC